MTIPTDAEIDDMLPEIIGKGDFNVIEYGRKVARAVLAKWGQPQAGAGGEPFGYVFTQQFAPIVGDERKINREVFTRQKPACAATALYTAPPPQAVREPQCWCLTCRPISFGDPGSMRMALCPTCGNKRCPKANDHRNACTNSNEPGQPGSSWENVKPITAHGVADMKGGQHGAE